MKEIVIVEGVGTAVGREKGAFRSTDLMNLWIWTSTQQVLIKLIIYYFQKRMLHKGD